MSKRSDVAYGRRGGHQVPDGFDPRSALAVIERVRAEHLAAGTWPDASCSSARLLPVDGQRRMAAARLAAGVPLDDADREALAP